MKISVINTLPYPSPEASINRILSYSKGLVAIGNTVDLLSSAYSSVKNGQIDGTNFWNYGTKPRRSFISLFQTLLSIIRKIRLSKYDVVIIVSQSAFMILPIQIVAKLLNIPVVYEVSEYPFSIMTGGIKNRITAAIHTNISFKLFDGMIVMTKALLDYYKRKGNNRCKFIIVPMTVDVSRFNSISEDRRYFFKYIAYCGDMSGNKDGVLNLIKSYQNAKKHIPGIKLLLIGGASDTKSLELIKEYVAQNQLKDIVFTGKVDREEIPSLLFHAEALALARPTSLQAQGGFPTKLGEYLLTGKPVIVTAVGEIPIFLNDTNSFISPPDDIDSFTNRMLQVFEDYNKALKIGAEGKKLALSIFNGEKQAQRINEYLLKFIK